MHPESHPACVGRELPRLPLTHTADLSVISHILVLCTVAIVSIKSHLFFSGEIRSGRVATGLTVLGGLSLGQRV